MIMKEAMDHNGYALVDILQPCVTFNKVNTFSWYKQRVTPIDSSHDVTDREAAMRLANTWGDEIPIGILYKVDKPVYTDRRPVLNKGIIPKDLKESNMTEVDRLRLFA